MAFSWKIFEILRGHRDHLALCGLRRPSDQQSMLYETRVCTNSVCHQLATAEPQGGTWPMTTPLQGSLVTSLRLSKVIRIMAPHEVPFSYVCLAFPHNC